MRRFVYIAKNEQGEKVKGFVDAFNEKRAGQTLHEKGLFIIDLKSKEHKSYLEEFLSRFTRVSGRNVAVFTRVLATMIRTGLPLTTALESLRMEAENIKFSRVIEEVNKEVQSGSSLALAMKQHGEVFNELYTSMIEAGESSGNLDQVMERLAQILEASESLKAKVKSAMIYPLVILIVMIGIGALMMIMVIPKIAEVYKEMDAVLPLPTQILVGFSDLAAKFWWLILGLVVGAVLLIKNLRKNKNFDYWFNNLVMKVPIWGMLKKEEVWALFTRTLGILLKSGVAILKSLKISASTLGNNQYQKVVLEASAEVEKGTSLSSPLEASGLFPGIVIQLISAGEETGTMDESLMKLADYFDEQVETLVKNLTSILEPIMIVIMGTAVAGLAIAILMPMFNLVNVIK